MSFSSTNNNLNFDGKLDRPIIAIFILGGPGAGKGTQCAKLVEKYSNIVTLSTGNLLRALKKSGTEEGNRIAKQMAEGKLVDINATERLLKPKFAEHLNNCDVNDNLLFLIDGFPRDMSILNDWQNGMSNQSIVPFIIEFVCDADILKQRLLKRQNNEIKKRNDNNIKAIENRIALFENATQDVIATFKKMQKHKTIDATKSEDEVFTSLCKIIDPVLNNLHKLEETVLASNNIKQVSQIRSLKKEALFNMSMSDIKENDDMFDISKDDSESELNDNDNDNDGSISSISNNIEASLTLDYDSGSNCSNCSNCSNISSTSNSNCDDNECTSHCSGDTGDDDINTYINEMVNLLYNGNEYNMSPKSMVKLLSTHTIL